MLGRSELCHYCSSVILVAIKQKYSVAANTVINLLTFNVGRQVLICCFGIPDARADGLTYWIIKVISVEWSVGS